MFISFELLNTIKAWKLNAERRVIQTPAYIKWRKIKGRSGLIKLMSAKNDLRFRKDLSVSESVYCYIKHNSVFVRGNWMDKYVVYFI